ncbi:putative transcription factor C2H2 family [Helianthus annuus]|nr:putative transcription factor C2H2 family [Helianthus annuus]
MKTLADYLTEDEEDVVDMNTRCNFDFKGIKRDLNFCRLHRHDEEDDVNSEDDDRNQIVPRRHRCGWMFDELTLAASKMADHMSLSVEQLVRLHFTSGLSRLIWCLFQCFADDQEQLLNKGLMLIQFAVMNAIALRKILKKYDKVHECANGMNFKSELQAKHLDILQSPCEGSVLTLVLLGSEKLDCSLICPICLDLVFQPYALSCGHIFCKSCACLAAHVLIIEGLKYASSDSKCPVCRESGVYDKPVCMSELGLLLQQR